MAKQLSKSVISISADKQTRLLDEDNLEPFESEEEVKAFVEAVIEAGIKLGKSDDQTKFWAEEVRWGGYAIHERNGPEVAEKSSEQILKYIAKYIAKVHRTTVSRHWLAGQADSVFGLPYGEVKESVHRDLRTRVHEDRQQEVLDLALEKSGEYGKIQAKDITAIAKELGVYVPKRSEPEDAADPDDVTESDNDSEAPDLSADEEAEDKSQVAVQTTAVEDFNVPDPINPAFPIITGNRKNIAPTVRFLEICHVVPELAALIGNQSPDERWALLGELKREAAKPRPQRGKRKPRRK